MKPIYYSDLLTQTIIPKVVDKRLQNLKQSCARNSRPSAFYLLRPASFVAYLSAQPTVHRLHVERSQNFQRFLDDKVSINTNNIMMLGLLPGIGSCDALPRS